jgi:hypothetical protein
MSDLPIVIQALGTAAPLSTVTVKSQISGYLAEVAFKEGKWCARAISSPRSIRGPTKRDFARLSF